MKILVSYQLVLVNIFLLISKSFMAEQESSFCIDWSKCILFLETTAETLQAPGNTRRSDIDSATGFHTLANNILRFYELECLPIQLNIERLR